MNPLLLAAVAGGGALGSMARYAVGIASVRWFGPGFPWGTLLINILGSFVIGALAEMFALRWDASQPARAFLVIGICGGFTTFSTFSLDVVTLLNRGETLPAAAYALASVILSVMALLAAVYILRAVFN